MLILLAIILIVANFIWHPWDDSSQELHSDNDNPHPEDQY